MNAAELEKLKKRRADRAIVASVCDGAKTVCAWVSGALVCLPGYWWLLPLVPGFALDVAHGMLLVSIEGLDNVIGAGLDVTLIIVRGGDDE